MKFYRVNLYLRAAASNGLFSELAYNMQTPRVIAVVIVTQISSKPPQEVSHQQNMLVLAPFEIIIFISIAK